MYIIKKMKVSNKIRTYKLDNKYVAYYFINSKEYLIKGEDLPFKLAQTLMKKHNAKYFEVKKWKKLYYDIDLKQKF